MSLGVKHRHAPLATAHTVGGTTHGTTETVFQTSAGVTSTGYILEPGGSIRKGDFWQGFVMVDTPATNSTDTVLLRVYLGPTSDPTTGILVASQTAINVSNDDEIAIHYSVACEEIGAGSTARFSAAGVSWADGATAPSLTNAKTATDAQVSTLTDLCFGVTATWSVSSSGNSARLRAHHNLKYPALPSQ